MVLSWISSAFKKIRASSAYWGAIELPLIIFQCIWYLHRDKPCNLHLADESKEQSLHDSLPVISCILRLSLDSWHESVLEVYVELISCYCHFLLLWFQFDASKIKVCFVWYHLLDVSNNCDGGCHQKQLLDWESLKGIFWDLGFRSSMVSSLFNIYIYPYCIGNSQVKFNY